RTIYHDPQTIDAMVLTTPYYAGVLHVFPSLPRYYWAYDPFRFYDWNQAQIGPLQKQLLDGCTAIFAVSRALVDDLSAMTSRPVDYLPNAVSESFVEQLAQSPRSIPDDLAAIARPIVCCVGQMNRS